MELGQRAQFFFYAFNAAFHVAVLPRFAWFAGTEGNAKSSTGGLVAFAQVFRAAVAVKNCRTGMSAQCLDESDVSEAAAVGGTELPAQHLTGAEIHHERHSTYRSECAGR